MINRAVLVSLILSTTLLFHGCASIQQNAPKMVWIKYAHLANVRSFQPQPGSFQYAAASSDGFWAVFELCSIDVQGSALNGFNYDAAKFLVPWGSTKIDASTPGTVGRSDAVGLPMPNPQVNAVVQAAFGKGPSAQFLPKKFYPNIGYRFAIFFNSYPAGYLGEPMTLQYDGQPQVAAVVQNVASNNPQFIPFYNHTISPAITSTCP